MIASAMTIRILAVLLVGYMPLAACADEKLSVLQEALRQSFPNVVRWEVLPISAVHAKRELKLFAQSRLGVRIYRDGALFAVDSDPRAHYLVKAHVETLIARKFLHKGDVLTAENTEIETHDMFAFHCNLVERDSRLARMRSRRDLRPRAVICSRDVAMAPLIARHDTVFLNCSRGSVHISVVAEAMEEGNVGSRIRVRQDASHPLVLATVIGKGEVNACI